MSTDRDRSPANEKGDTSDWEGHQDFQDDTQTQAHITDPLHQEDQARPEPIQRKPTGGYIEGEDEDYCQIGGGDAASDRPQNFFDRASPQPEDDDLGEEDFEEGGSIPDLSLREAEGASQENQEASEQLSPAGDRIQDSELNNMVCDEPREEEEQQPPEQLQMGPADGALSYKQSMDVLTIAQVPAKDNFSQQRSHNQLTEYRYQDEPDQGEIQWLESQLKGLFEEDVIQPRDTQFDSAPTNYVKLVKSTWNQAKKVGSKKLGRLVMRNFFMQSPQALQLFSFKNSTNLYKSEELRKTSSKLLSVINQVVASLGDEGRMREITIGLQNLGQKHKEMGVEADHFGQMCRALMIALGITLKDKFTNDVCLSWALVLRKLAADMTIPDEEEYEQEVAGDSDKDQETASEGVLNASSNAEDKLDGFLSLPSGDAPVASKTVGLEEDLEEMGIRKSKQEQIDDDEEFRSKSLQHLQTIWKKSERKSAAIEESFRSMLSGSDRGLLINDSTEMIQRKKSSTSGNATEVRNYYQQIFQKEVDFHHKVAYRFEKGYGLSKQYPEKVKAMNMEILECIAEHSAYVESDPMCLFYCLFFCIVYRNDSIVEFLRTIIQKLPMIPKLDKLLELIDVYGLKRLWTKGDPISQLTCHMVFYQAIDDNLRVVYKMVFLRHRFFQLRDKDALHFLNDRDYEMIKRALNTHVTRIDLKQTFQREQSLKCHSYRKYNQAYFEEISVVRNVDSRVQRHYRERFIITQEDIYTVFEMYCKEDYHEQFKRTDKTLITKAQFKELFRICLKNDSFKVAIIIYCLYLNQADFDSKMMTLMLETIQDSVKFHEIKLFFLMEHFDELSVYQLNQLLDIYEQILHTSDPRYNPIVSQYNPAKVALLIYRICWMIQEREIYSLVTKCYQLQSFLSKCIITYLERQKNLLVTHKRLTEPILSLTQTKDCFDLMSEMNLIDLLQHPVVIELLSLAFEGNYSVSGSALNLSPTFQAMLDAPLASDKVISRKIMGNVMTFGNNSLIQQSSMMYNIWLVSISQRLDDEVLFTGVYGFIVFCLFIAYAVVSNESLSLAKQHLGGPLAGHQALFIDMNPKDLVHYCEEEADLLIAEYDIVRRLVQLSLFGNGAFLTSVFQRIIATRVRNNVKLNSMEITCKLAFVLVQIIFFYYCYPKQLNVLFVQTCSKVIDYSAEDKDQLNQQFSFRYPVDSQITSEALLSLMTFILGLICFEAFQRSSGIGRMLTMFQEMILQLFRFFATFGLGMALFYIAGRLILKELKLENDFLLTNLFDGLNGRAELEQFTKPIGQVFISSYTFIFRALALSVLSAVFINKYKDAFTNLESVKRQQIIHLRNQGGYDSQVGGLTIPFFPFSLLVIPFWPAILIMRNKALNEFALKIAYGSMVLIYGCVVVALSLPMIPLLYLKMIANSLYALIIGAREQDKNQNLYTFLLTIMFGLPLILMSLLVDFVKFPQHLMRSQKDFENKYRTDIDEMNEQQTETVSKLFYRLFKGDSRYLFEGKTYTLGQLMTMHKTKFQLVSYMHELFCRGTKDYIQAVSNVKDYNLTKTVTAKCAIPDKNGDFVRGQCVMDLIRNVQEDLEIYTYMEKILQQHHSGSLAEEVQGRRKDRERQEDSSGEGQPEGQLYVEPIAKDAIRWRNPIEFNMNFSIDVAAIAFTSIQDEMIGDIDTSEIKRVKRYEKEIEDRKQIWKGNTVSKFEAEMNACLAFVRKNVAKEQPTRDHGYI